MAVGAFACSLCNSNSRENSALQAVWAPDPSTRFAAGENKEMPNVAALTCTGRAVERTNSEEPASMDFFPVAVWDNFPCMRSSFDRRWHKKCFLLIFVVFLDICILHSVLNARVSAALLYLCRHHYIILEGRGIITLIFHIWEMTELVMSREQKRARVCWWTLAHFFSWQLTSAARS